jgi:hypothetical protein
MRVGPKNSVRADSSGLNLRGEVRRDSCCDGRVGIEFRPLPRGRASCAPLPARPDRAASEIAAGCRYAAISYS